MPPPLRLPPEVLIHCRSTWIDLESLLLFGSPWPLNLCFGFAGLAGSAARGHRGDRAVPSGSRVYAGRAGPVVRDHTPESALGARKRPLRASAGGMRGWGLRGHPRPSRRSTGHSVAGVPGLAKVRAPGPPTFQRPRAASAAYRGPCAWRGTWRWRRGRRPGSGCSARAWSWTSSGRPA